MSKKSEKGIKGRSGDSLIGLVEKVRFEQSLRCLPADIWGRAEVFRIVAVQQECACEFREQQKCQRSQSRRSSRRAVGRGSER